MVPAARSGRLGQVENVCKTSKKIRTTVWYPSKYGSDDILGAMNLITPGSVLGALSLVKKGIIFDLSHDLEEAMPLPGAHRGFYAITQNKLESASAVHEKDLGAIHNGFSAQNLRIEMSDHSGTHIDQLNHVGIKQENGEYLLYNGIPNSSVIDTCGTRKIGIETMPPLVTRGVLIDVAKSKRVAYLEAGYAIQPDELDEALAAQKNEVRRGDTVLLRTGWGQFWKSPEKFLSGEPGLGEACAGWALDREIVCWGCDQFATDPIPFEKAGEALPMHLEMLTKAGIRLMENVYLEEIAGKGVYEFCLLAAPLKIKGATASPIRLLALT
jgi:kynurenine formamidase